MFQKHTLWLYHFNKLKITKTMIRKLPDLAIYRY